MKDMPLKEFIRNKSIIYSIDFSFVLFSIDLKDEIFQKFKLKKIKKDLPIIKVNEPQYLPSISFAEDMVYLDEKPEFFISKKLNERYILIQKNEKYLFLLGELDSDGEYIYNSPLVEWE